jgi:anti-anti-sigma factor
MSCRRSRDPIKGYMTVTDNAFLSARSTSFAERRGAGVSVESAGPTTIICLSGEVDASNMQFVSDVLDRFALGRGRIVLDARRLDFIGAQGLRLLIGFDQKCQRRDVVWALVPCRILRRLLQVTDVEQALPMAESVGDARSMLESVEASPRERTLQRVAPEKLRC